MTTEPASIGRVSNLTLRSVGERKVLCVAIIQGRLDLEECDISAAALSSREPTRGSAGT